MTHINLEYNNGFTWSESGGIWTKGFIYQDGSCITGKALCGYFRDVDSEAALIKKLENCNGCFSVIISGDEVLLACDPVRVFPLFYLSHGEDIYVSDSAEMLARKAGGMGLNLADQADRTTGNGYDCLPGVPLLNKTLINEPAASEFLATGYVTGKETLVRNLFQVQAGEIVHLSGKGSRGKFYSTYQSDRYLAENDSHKLADRLEQIFDRVFIRLIKSMEGRTVVIPLSGGFDSRLIAAMLKKLGYSKVICYTYGRPGNADIEPSHRVAGILGWPWKYVEYDNDLIKDYLNDPGFSSYFRYSANLVSMFFLQEYFAVRYLKDNELIPDDSVFVPGHSGDFFAGSMYLKHGLPQGDRPVERIAKKIFDTKYSLCRPSGEQEKLMLGRIIKSLQEKEMIPGAYAHTVHEDWDLKEKLAKFIVNSCNVYSWFGYEYRLPLYDMEFVEFFRNIRFEDKVNKKLYDEVLMNRVFRPAGLLFEKEVQPAAAVQKAAYLKSFIRRILPFSSGRPVKNDPLFYREITQLMIDDLKRKGIDIGVQGRAYNSLIVQWYLHQLYEH